jgi:predicted unusual protein kinase regulating ubiquinone biosynthesis (AarF/ABC1/UbiB family)
MPKTPDDQDERISRFVEALRGESQRGLGGGLGRFVRMGRGAAGLWLGVLTGSGRGAEAELSEKDLKNLEGLVTRLGELKGLPMKFGQIMSYLELELPDEARRLLSLLQTQSPATPFEKLEAIVREDLPSARADELLARLDRVPASVASIGQVHRAALPDGTEVAVKVRHPDIEAAIRSDFRLAGAGTGIAGAMLPGMGATARDVVRELEARLLEECDYGLEAARQQQFATLFADHPDIVIPKVHQDFCGARVLTTTWEAGRDFEAFRAAATQAERDRAGEILFDFYIGTLYRHGLFHADPHPGNYNFREDGRVAVLDFGCVRTFEPEVARAFVALAAAVRADDRARIVGVLERLGAAPSRNDAAYNHLRSLLRSFFGPLLVDGPHPIDGRIVVNIGKMARDKMALARLRLPGELTFLFRIRFGLYAVLSRLGSVADWAEIERKLSSEVSV